MLLNVHGNNILTKLLQVSQTYEKLIFKPIKELECSVLETKEHFRMPPQKHGRAIAIGDIWGGEYITGWFQTYFEISEEMVGKALYLLADVGARESLLFINNKPRGIYANKIVINNLGNHHVQLLTLDGDRDEKLHIALESYCWHNVPGNQPFSIAETGDRKATFGGMFVATMDEVVKKFVFDLRTVCELAEHGYHVFGNEEAKQCLMSIYKYIPQKPEEVEENVWRAGVLRAIEAMQVILSKENTSSAPEVSIIGHSHLDTAWQWTVEETARKAARTYSNALRLMEQYPEYKFLQSSSFHGEMMRRHYPDIFQGIQQRVEEGRYEPNGGAYVECDCLVTSGESIIRQFLWGQRFTQKYYGYRSDTFWLPDSFGFTASLPQILQGCGIKYFSTTKLRWNDTTVFPYTSFYWKGIDGSTVLSHFNEIHTMPSPKELNMRVYGTKENSPIEKNILMDKRMNANLFLPFGFGDGGGGPSYDMLELAERVRNLEGCPKVRYSTMSEFMESLEEMTLPVYKGELYLETHRGTLTSIAAIKKLNRLAEVALHHLEFGMALNFMEGKVVPDINTYLEKMLVNQFHDIIPGTSLAEVNDQAIQEMREVIEIFSNHYLDIIKEGNHREDIITLSNTISWDRDTFILEEARGPIQAEKQQLFTNIEGKKYYYVEDIVVPAMGSIAVEKGQLDCAVPSVFIYQDNCLETPLYQVEFDTEGRIISLYSKKYQRQLVSKGAKVNEFMMAEDIPFMWDNWNIDQDVLENMEHATTLLASEVVADGALMFRLRNTYQLGSGSLLKQDVIFYAHKDSVEFETEVDWKEKHKLLKVGFDLNVNVSHSKHEVQFGYIERPTHKSNIYEWAKYEVGQYRYSDFSENRFGIALLNDCKYGISTDQSLVALTLIKGGTHPDTRGDEGIHRFNYALVPHSGFSAENVIRPAYEFNMPICVIEECANERDSFIQVSESNIIVETIKVAEERDGIIIRLYEAEGSGCTCQLKFREMVELIETNMIEEDIQMLEKNVEYTISFKAFEVKTYKLKK